MKKIPNAKRTEYTGQLVDAWRKSLGREVQRKIEGLLLIINEPFLRHLVGSLRGQLYYDDLLNHLRMSLFPALRSFNPGKRNHFLSYWAWQIRSANTLWWANEFGVMPQKHFTPKPDAPRWRKKQHYGKERINEVISLDTGARMDFVSRTHPVVYNEGLDHVKALINKTDTLKKEERDILYKKFVLNLTLDDIALQYGVSRQRIQQKIKDNALPKIRMFIEFQKSLFFKRFGTKY